MTDIVEFQVEHKIDGVWQANSTHATEGGAQSYLERLANSWTVDQYDDWRIMRNIYQKILVSRTMVDGSPSPYLP